MIWDGRFVSIQPLPITRATTAEAEAVGAAAEPEPEPVPAAIADAPVVSAATLAVGAVTFTRQRSSRTIE